MRHNGQVPEQVADVMTYDLVVIKPDDRLERARDMLIAIGIHALPVMDDDDVVGIITSTDLIDDWPEHTPVADVMTPVPTSIAAEASIREAAEVMINHRIHHLLVCDGDEVIGILSSFDLLDALTVPTVAPS